MNEFLQRCRNAIGEQYVLTDDTDLLAYETEWRQRFRGRALAVVRPGSTSEVAAIVTLCKQFTISVVPQGGNTGLVLGSIPDASGTSIILSLKRLNAIRAIDVANNTMTVEAGCILSQIQQYADSHHRLFPLSLASEGTCTIGGNLSSNAGGTAVLRYGNARELCLGVEVVTANGDIWEGLKGLRKDNTGYDLRDLFIGAEGTLGIITAAVLKLYPKPKAIQTAFLALSSPTSALNLLGIAAERTAGGVTSFELMARSGIEAVLKHAAGCRDPLASPHPWYVLIELSDQESEIHAREMMERVLESALA